MEREKRQPHLLRKILKQRDIPPPLHIPALKTRQLLEFRLLGILVQGLEERLREDKVLIVRLVVDLDVREVGVHTEREVGGERPGRGRPCEERGFGVVDEWEGDRHYACEKKDVTQYDLIAVCALRTAQQ